jgi:hypothetical protein
LGRRQLDYTREVIHLGPNSNSVEENDHVRRIFIAWRNPPLSHKRSGSKTYRIAQAHKRDKLAWSGNGHGSIAGRATRDDSETRSVLVDRVRLAQVRGENKLDKGGHFAAWEQPKLFAEEVRAGFRPLRK